MKTYRVDIIKNYISPVSPYWARVGAAKIPMMPTPLGMQPTEYIRVSWDKRPYGQTPSLDVKSVHDGEIWAIHASWKGSEPGTYDFPDALNGFPDALAVAFPVRNNPVMVTMGGEDAPVHILHWTAQKEGVMSVLATGIGTSEPGPNLKCAAQAVMEEQIWRLVITRPLGSGHNVAPLIAGKKTGVGFVLWLGANEERAGIKAFSIDWTKLDLEA